MKFLLCAVVAFCALSCALCQTPQKNKELEARRAAWKCVREHKVLYSVAIKYSKGDMNDDSPKSKCFLKCFALKIGLFNDTTLSLQKEVVLQYVTFLPSNQLPYEEIVDKCDRVTERSEDLCDYIYRAYKCIWDEIKNAPEPESVRFSFYDVLGFNELYDKEDFHDDEPEEEAKTEQSTETESSAETEMPAETEE